MNSTKMKDMFNTDENQQNKPKQSLEEKKALYQNQIKELNRIKGEINQSLKTFDSISEKKPNDHLENRVTDLPNSNQSIKNELFKFAGVKCVKCFKDEYIFHFFAKGEGNKTYTYSVQFFNIDMQGELGKWTLPTFIDINWILKDTPINNIAYAGQFIRNCKHYIDCYHNRMNQFATLNKYLETVRNCVANADRSYKYINIELYGVYDAESDDYINIIVYLVYDLKEARPQQITVDSRHGAPLDKQLEKHMKSYLKPFKKFNLREALENIESKNNPIFSWRKVEKEQTLLDVRDLEDESSLEENSPERKRRRRSTPHNSQEETGADIEYRKKSKKSKFTNTKKRKTPIRRGSFQKRKRSIEAKSKKVDISRFLTKNDKDNSSPQPKDPSKSGNEEFEKKSSSQEKIKPNHDKLTQKSQEKTLEAIQKSLRKKSLRKDPELEEISEPHISREGRVLRSATNSPKKVATPKKVSLEKVETHRKLVSPKKIVTSKKLASLKKSVSSKIELTSQTVKTRLMQTSLKIQYSNGISPTAETNNPVHTAKILRSKVVTSTPMPINRKRSLEGDLDISEIQSIKNQQATKTQTTRSLRNEMRKDFLTGKSAAKSGIKKPNPVKK